MATLIVPSGKGRTPQRQVRFLDYGLRIAIVTITREIAAEWLTHNKVNRTMRLRHLERVKTALTLGLFRGLNGQTIVFSEDGDLLDGQHRLTGVVDTGIPITTLVVYGVQEQTRATIDTGAGRQLGDYLAMRGHANASNLAAALGFYKAWELGQAHNPHRVGSLFATYDEGIEYLLLHPGIEASVARSKRLPALLRPSHAAALDYAFGRLAPALGICWYETMRTGRFHGSDVFLTLRERLIRDRTSNIPRHVLEHFVYSIKAWNAARDGTTLKVFRWGEGEEIPPIR
jgi:hypothetical protein